MPTFAVITVNYGSSALISENFAGLPLGDDGRLIIVDSFSSQAERTAIRAVGEELGAECILLDVNGGYGGGTNAGAARAIDQGVDVIVVLNPDARIDDRSMRTIVDAAYGTKDLISPRIVDGAGRNWFSGSDLYLDDGTTAGHARRAERSGRPRREWATGACFALAADVWTALDGFDEEYFLYWEDIDLSHRVLDAGGSLVLADALVVHDEGGTHEVETTERAKSPTYYYFNIRNRMLYARKHLADEDVRRWSRSAWRVGYGILLQGGRRQLLSATPWRAYVRGVRDGRRLSRGKAGAK